jgi:hypothetical protein
VLGAIAIIPSAPVMVPELAGVAAAELVDLREAVFAAAASLPARWIAVGVAPVDAAVPPSATGTFGGYGVDLPISLSPASSGQAIELPLCALIAGWVRTQVNQGAAVEVRAYADDYDADAAAQQGRRLRAEIDEGAAPIGVLVVADGAHTLTAPAPGGYDPDSIPVQAALDDALAGGDAAALIRLPDAIVGRVAYQVLAGVTTPKSAKELYRGAPYGVGYWAGIWQS